VSGLPVEPGGALPGGDGAAGGPAHGGAVPVGPGVTPAPLATPTSGGRSRPRDGDLMSAPGEAPGPPAPDDPGDAALLALVDRLAVVLERADLAELEVGSGGTTIVVRSPWAADRRLPASAAAGADAGAAPGVPAVPPAEPGPVAPAARPSVKAPLTGIFYAAPSPGATPYVSVGDYVSSGQIIGLIEAMKLFNEIKSDLAGRVVRVCAESGQLVKAKSPLIEVEPA